MIPFDMVPRIFTAKEWELIESGIKQRTKALNLFLNDIYNSANIIKEKIIPADLVYGAVLLKVQWLVLFHQEKFFHIYRVLILLEHL